MWREFSETDGVLPFLYECWSVGREIAPSFMWLTVSDEFSFFPAHWQGEWGFFCDRTQLTRCPGKWKKMRPTQEGL